MHGRRLPRPSKGCSGPASRSLCMQGEPRAGVSARRATFAPVAAEKERGFAGGAKGNDTDKTPASRSWRRLPRLSQSCPNSGDAICRTSRTATEQRIHSGPDKSGRGCSQGTADRQKAGPVFFPKCEKPSGPAPLRRAFDRRRARPPCVPHGRDGGMAFFRSNKGIDL